jgi:putative restriction endonuclease
MPARGTESLPRAFVLDGRADAVAIGRAWTAARGTVTEDELRGRFASVKCWKSGDHRAPHKPLLLLAALARVQRGEPRLWGFSAGDTGVEPVLERLLLSFGKNGDARTGYPFWRLQSDRIWEVVGAEEARLHVNASGDARITDLRRRGVAGGFDAEADAVLRANPRLVEELTRDLLDRNFPPSEHEEILDAVGMPWRVVTARPRDPRFKELILRIYEQQCAFCGFGGRLTQTVIGIDAAHVKWHAAGGPDDEENGMALCALHHRLFDRGAMSLTDDHRILVSEHFAGSDVVSTGVAALTHRPLRRPISGRRPPGAQFLSWHRREVFRAPARGGE